MQVQTKNVPESMEFPIWDFVFRGSEKVHKLVPHRQVALKHRLDL